MSYFFPDSVNFLKKDFEDSSYNLNIIYLFIYPHINSLLSYSLL